MAAGVGKSFFCINGAFNREFIWYACLFDDIFVHRSFFAIRSTWIVQLKTQQTFYIGKINDAFETQQQFPIEIAFPFLAQFCCALCWRWIDLCLFQLDDDGAFILVITLPLCVIAHRSTWWQHAQRLSTAHYMQHTHFTLGPWLCIN